MAVTSMRLVNVTGSLSRLDATLDACCAGGDFQFEQAMSYFGDKSDFTSINDENPYAPFLARLSSAVTSAKLELAPETEEERRTSMAVAWNEVGSYIEEIDTQLKTLTDELKSPLAEIEQLTVNLEELKHFSGLDIELSEIFECEYIKVRFGRLPKESYNKLKYYRDNPYIMLLPCDSDAHYVWGVYFAPIESVAEVDRIFQSLMWERLHIPEATGTPAAECEAMEKRIAELREQEIHAKRRLTTYWKGNKLKCSRTLHLLERSSQSFELRRYVARYKTGDRFFLTGWITEDDSEGFRKRLGTIPDVDCEIEMPDSAEGHNPPVKLRNRPFARAFEGYVSMYGLPSYGEIDPTPFVAATYFLLFGMMFADVGQGIVLALIGYFFMWKKQGNSVGRVLGVCGFSSVIFGTMLGSVFGFEHWLDPFWAWVHDKTGVSLNEGKLINVEDSQVVTTLIYATIGIGAFLVLCAMLVNIYSKLRQRMWGEALFGQNGLAGLVFYGSVVYTAVNMLLFKKGMPGTLYILLLIVLPLVLIFLREPLSGLVEGHEDWMPESIGDFLMQNVFELFEVLLSYVSNTVSFLRVGAFILVHFGMMTVVFTIAEFNPVGSIGYILVVIIGNAIVIALEGLLVSIQALRLEYYEMFSRFYDGSGRPFTPTVRAVSEQN